METEIQCTILLDDKNDTVALTVKIDAVICNNGLVDELWNCGISGVLLRGREVFDVSSCYTAYAASCLTCFSGRPVCPIFNVNHPWTA